MDSAVKRVAGGSLRERWSSRLRSRQSGSEFVADITPEGELLGEADVVRLGGRRPQKGRKRGATGRLNPVEAGTDRPVCPHFDRIGVLG
jgi:hypothetical protein